MRQQKQIEPRSKLTGFLPIISDTADEKEQQKIFSNHALQIAQDKESNITFGTLNTAMTESPATSNIDNSTFGKPFFNDPQRFARIGSAIKKATEVNPELGIIALQRVPSSPMLVQEHQDTDAKNSVSVPFSKLSSKVDIDAEIDIIKKQNPIKLDEKQSDYDKRIAEMTYYLAPNITWAQTGLSEHLPAWRLATESFDQETGMDGFKAILYDPEKFEETEDDKGLSIGNLKDLYPYVQVLQLRKKDSDQSFIVYNVHLPYLDNPADTQRYIDQIRILPHNAGKTVYIMGDLNGRFPPTDPNYHHNGTSIVAENLRQNGKRNYDCTDAFLKSKGQHPIQILPSEVLDFSTGQQLKHQNVSLLEIEQNPDFNHFVRICYAHQHQIFCHGVSTPQTTDQLLLYIPFKDPAGSSKFLEKNIYNVPRIVIAYSKLSKQACNLLNVLEVEEIIQDESRPKGYVLYPHKAKDYIILQKLHSDVELKKLAQKYNNPFARVMMTILSLLSVSSFAGGILGGFITANFLGIAPLAFALSAVFLVAALITREVKNYSKSHLSEDSKAMSSKLFLVGAVIGVLSAAVYVIAPSLVSLAYLSIPIAPVVLATVFAAMFILSAIIVYATDSFSSSHGTDTDSFATTCDSYNSLGMSLRGNVTDKPSPPNSPVSASDAPITPSAGTQPTTLAAIRVNVISNYTAQFHQPNGRTVQNSDAPQHSHIPSAGDTPPGDQVLGL